MSRRSQEAYDDYDSSETDWSDFRVFKNQPVSSVLDAIHAANARRLGPQDPSLVVFKPSRPATIGEAGLAVRRSAERTSAWNFFRSVAGAAELATDGLAAHFKTRGMERDHPMALTLLPQRRSMHPKLWIRDLPAQETAETLLAEMALLDRQKLAAPMLGKLAVKVQHLDILMPDGDYDSQRQKRSGPNGSNNTAAEGIRPILTAFLDLESENRILSETRTIERLLGRIAAEKLALGSNFIYRGKSETDQQYIDRVARSFRIDQTLRRVQSLMYGRSYADPHLTLYSEIPDYVPKAMASKMLNHMQMKLGTLSEEDRTIVLNPLTTYSGTRQY